MQISQRCWDHFNKEGNYFLGWHVTMKFTYSSPYSGAKIVYQNRLLDSEKEWVNLMICWSYGVDYLTKYQLVTGAYYARQRCSIYSKRRWLNGSSYVIWKIHPIIVLIWHRQMLIKIFKGKTGVSLHFWNIFEVSQFIASACGPLTKFYFGTKGILTI